MSRVAALSGKCCEASSVWLTVGFAVVLACDFVIFYVLTVYIKFRGVFVYGGIRKSCRLRGPLPCGRWRRIVCVYRWRVLCESCSPWRQTLLLVVLERFERLAGRKCLLRVLSWIDEVVGLAGINVGGGGFLCGGWMI